MEKAHFIENRVFRDKRGTFSPLDLSKLDKIFFEMNEGDEVYVPRYFAHGFITLEKDTVVQYLVDNDYSPENEGVKVWTDYPEIENKIKELDSFFGKELIIIDNKDLIEK